MQQSGYTFVRVFCYKGHYMLVGLNPPVYCVGGPDSTNVPELSAPYMANVIDFLTRANKHDIYVSIHIGGWSWNKYYRNMADSGFSYITGSNREWLAGGAINAKKIYIGQFIGYIKNYNPKLLSTILAFDMHNEVWCTTVDKPFSLTSSWVLTANGEEYFDTRNPQYARKLVHDLGDWSYDNPVPKKPSSYGPWYIRVAVAHTETIMNTFCQLLDSPDVDNVEIFRLLYAIRIHCDYLEKCVIADIGTSEDKSKAGDTLKRIAAVYPEFKNLSAWSKTGQSK